jgi:acetyl-CoA carboxylase carboxyltransferase component
VPEVKRIVALLAGITAMAAVMELLRRRRGAAPRRTPVEPPDERADELRRRLADQREAESTAPAAAAQAPGVDESLSVDEARRRVHDEARATLDEMRRQAQI